MLVEALENHYRDLANERQGRPSRWNRASSIGRCPRELCYQKLGVVGAPITPRRMAVFHHGNYMDRGLKEDLMAALGDSVITTKLTGSIVIDEVHISAEADALFTVNGRKGVADVKTMSNFAFERACKAVIDDTYQAQGWIYAEVFKVDLVVFVCYRKETSHLCEVIFDRQAPELIITQRFGGDERKLYTDDPLLITEVRTPFDGHIQEKIRATIRAVGRCVDGQSLPDRPYAPVMETTNIQNKEEKAEAVKLYGEPISKSGSWSKFQTGRQILEFPCSYCAFISQCFPQAYLEIENGKPKWIT